MAANIVKIHPHPERIPFKRNWNMTPNDLRSHPDNPRITNKTNMIIIHPI